MTVPSPGPSGPAIEKARSGQGAGIEAAAMTEQSAAAAGAAAGEALALRDQALAALDEGDLPAALAAAGRGLAVLEAAGLRGGLDEAALLTAFAEIEEGAGRPRGAAAMITAVIAILG